MTQSDDAGHVPGGHVPVMLEELVAAVATDRDGHYVDATYGRGGHARRLLAELSPRARLLVLDRDADAIDDALRLAAQDSRVSVARGRFGDLADHLAEPSAGEREGPAPRMGEPSAGEREGPAPRMGEPSAGEREGPVVPCGVMFDVGVSSPQLDDARRGFSFALDGPLDMRMDQRDALTASAWLNTAATAEVEAVIRDYGEERFARRIARRVVAARPLETTAELASVVRAAVPGGHGPRDPATRVFQAIRIHLNDELNELARGLDAAFDALRAGGRLATITFHSLEHRLVRQRFRQWVRGPDTPRRLPVRGLAPGRARPVDRIGNGLRPSRREIEANPRARSAFLQAVEKTPPVSGDDP